MKSRIFYWLFVLAVFVSSCKTKNKDESQVVIWERSDPQMLNPINYTDAASMYIMRNLFQPLIDIDFKTMEPIPILVESRPLVEQMPDGKGMMFTYRMRPEAKWDDGTPITGKDVEFSLKVIKNPKVADPTLRPYFESVNDIKFYEDDPLKFTIITNKVYILSEAVSGDMSVLPKKIYDPKGLMENYTVKQLTEEADQLSNDPKIIEFAQDFNSEKYQRDPAFVIGSGAYRLKEWKTGQKVVLERKENWWGDQVKEKNMYHHAYPKRLVYRTINDPASAVVALKAGELDVMYSMKTKDFVELPQSEKFTQNFNAYNPGTLSYDYIGISCREPKFADTLTRQAIAHLVDVDKFIQTVRYNLAQRIIGPVHPSKVKEYNNDIKPYDFNPEKARELLAEAGWKDTNGDGTLDKVINGERVEFNATYAFNAGNDERKALGLMLQEEARKVGINIEVTPQEWSIYLTNNKKHKNELFYAQWGSNPTPSDHKQIYHTDSYTNEGSNYTGFGNAISDQLIDSMRVELNEEKRIVMQKRFQEILHRSAASIYLFSAKERIAISKRFTNAEPSEIRPGFWEAGFKLIEQ